MLPKRKCVGLVLAFAVSLLSPGRLPADDEPAFAELVGRYAAGLDAGRTPADAFSAATTGTHWERAAD